MTAPPPQPDRPPTSPPRTVTGAVGHVIRGLHLPRFRKPPPGTAPGIEHHDVKRLKAEAGPPQRVIFSCIDFCPEHVLMQDVLDVPAFLNEHRPAWSHVRWINIDGLGDPQIIQAIAAKYQLHPLAIEDVLHVHQRPKVESYPAQGDATPARLFIVARMIQCIEGHVHGEQISMFLGRNTVLTFQEQHGDVWMPIRERLLRDGSRLRQNDASFLVYTLLDAIVDHCFPILEHYSDRLEELEDEILAAPDQQAMHAIHAVKRELLLLRRQVWPMREMIYQLHREPQPNLAEITRTYLRDVYDHTIQIIDILETYRELSVGLTETYMTTISNRMNEVMKVLTMIATIFIPITFLAGVYGMNMPIPENHWAWSYALFWGVCLGVAGGMVWWFRKRKWL
jgi:magnesium transporter